jgi:Tfp pilus assembly protein PilN
MFSLLTKKYEQEVKREYYSRLVFVSLSFLLLTSITLLLSLIPYYYFLNLRTSTLTEQLATLKKTNSLRDETQMYEIVRNFNNTAAILSPELSALPIRDKMLQMISLKPIGVTLENLSWAGDPAPAGKFYLRGIADNRESLQKYIETLQLEKTFTNVEFSRNSYYTKDTNIDFSVDLSYKP